MSISKDKSFIYYLQRYELPEYISYFIIENIVRTDSSVEHVFIMNI